MPSIVDCNRFVNMRSVDLPDVWKEPIDPGHTREVALRLGVTPSDVLSFVCFEVNETALGLDYQRWAMDNSLPDSIPVLASCFSDFVQCDGLNRLAQFDHSMRNLGRPCHFVRVEGVNSEKYEMSSSQNLVVNPS